MAAPWCHTSRHQRERLERRVLSLLAAGKPSESLFDGLDISRCNSKARYGYGGDADAESERNPLRLFYFPWRLVSSWVPDSGVLGRAGDGTRDSEHGNFARRVPIPTSVFSRVRTETLVLHFPTAISRGQCRDAGPVVRGASTSPRAGLSQENIPDTPISTFRAFN